MKKIIKEIKIKNFVFLKIVFDGIYDNYILFGKINIFKTENDRYFWNDWK